jgi:hypothetical protein
VEDKKKVRQSGKDSKVKLKKSKYYRVGKKAR